MKFDGDRPIYLQLYEEFYHLIATGKWQPNSKIDSVRQLAIDYGVNPNTVQKALQELEREGLAKTDRTRGRFVTEEEDLIDKIRNISFLQACDHLIKIAEDLQMKPATALKYIEERWTQKRRDSDE